MSAQIRMRPPIPISGAGTMAARASASAPLSLTLRVKPLKEAIEGLLDEMRKSTLFDNERLKSSSDAAETLCNLVANVIRPAMLKASGLVIQEQMLDFDDKAKELLKPALPAGKDVEEEIREYSELSDGAKIEGIYADASTQLVRSEKDLLALAEEIFKTKKASLIRQNEERKQATATVNATLDQLTDRVDRMRDGLLDGLVAMDIEMTKEQASHGRVINGVRGL